MGFNIIDIMKKNICNLIKNKKGVAHPLEIIFAFGVIILSFSLIFTAVSQLFTPYSKDEFVLRSKAMAISERLIKDPGLSKDGTSDWELYPTINLKCLGFASSLIINDTWIVAPRILDDVDKTSIFYPNSTLLLDINNLTITKYSYRIRELVNPVRVKYVVADRIDYGVLDYDKIYALNKVLYRDIPDNDYYSAKEAIGLEDIYDFNIEIIDVNGKELLKYGMPYEDRDVVGEFSRNIRVYYSYSTSYIVAKLTVYVF